MRIIYNNDKIKLNQIDKINKLANKYNIKNNNQQTPIRTDKLLIDYLDKPIIDNVIEYQSIVGELLYISRMTRLTNFQDLLSNQKINILNMRYI